MSKTLFRSISSILIFSLLSGCNNPNSLKEQDPLKGQEDKFLEVSETSEPKEVVFYNLVDPKAEENSKANEEAAASEPVEQKEQVSDPLPTEALEAIRENAEIEKRKENALKTIKEAKRIESIITGNDHISDEGYTYHSDE